MKNLWLRFGCFLTGYNYEILQGCSEASAKSVKKYASALTIVGILWGFIGYNFSSQYLGSNSLISFCVALVMITIVFSIERQIILTIGKNWKAAAFRIVIGIIIAIIGSVIIDQIMFKTDINIQKEANLREMLIDELDKTIIQIDSTLSIKEAELSVINDKFEKKPNVRTVVTSWESERDTTTNEMVRKKVKSETVIIPNPVGERIPVIQVQIDTLNFQRDRLRNRRIAIISGAAITNGNNNDNSSGGFLEELTVMKSILLKNNEALFIWILFFLFFVSLELFVLVNKFGDSKNDYEETVIHQRELHFFKLKELSRLSMKP